MKKLILTFFVAFAALSIKAQTMAFTVLEIKVKKFTQDKIAEDFDNLFKDVKVNKGGIVLERIGRGRTEGMTHRLIFMSTLGVDLIDEDAIDPNKNDAFWSKMRNYVEEWGPFYSGRILSWQEGDTEKYSMGHIWDIKVTDQNQFKEGHDKIVSEFADDFKGRVVGFGTYDFGLPNGATHWLALTGKDTDDHLLLYDKLEKNPKFIKLISSRGKFELIKDFEINILKRKQ